MGSDRWGNGLERTESHPRPGGLGGRFRRGGRRGVGGGVGGGVGRGSRSGGYAGG